MGKLTCIIEEVYQGDVYQGDGDFDSFYHVQHE